MAFFLGVGSRKAVLPVFIFLLLGNLSAAGGAADTKIEDGDILEIAEGTASGKNTDQVEESIEETTDENDINKGGKQEMEETIEENYTKIKQDIMQAKKEAAKKIKSGDVDQEKNEETVNVTTESTEDQDLVQNAEPTEITEETDISQETTEVMPEYQDFFVSQQYEDRIQELKEEEMEAVMKNCSLASLDDGSGSPRPEVPRFQCRVSLWFQGKFPEWIKTFNFVKDLESLSEEELDKAAEAVCDCKIIDISDFCRAKVRESAQKIIDRCPRNTIITRLFKQTQSYFREDANLYYL
ncbi:uncharacterized protein [Palaemon carinicauda]|uniref:uncharacterized protein n=1 Tax=Palaemon carinicauda TaxID=392227 RepID=UPI0035B5E43B